ncbi:hypothetical protein NicSoilB8_20020 [Arthrobacter sp. NicSoilB8]|nr:hypothetical protein NicSoilB8_20020 [Arthrobacter sp. NicSoilB8]
MDAGGEQLQCPVDFLCGEEKAFDAGQDEHEFIAGHFVRHGRPSALRTILSVMGAPCLAGTVASITLSNPSITFRRQQKGRVDLARMPDFENCS